MPWLREPSRDKDLKEVTIDCAFKGTYNYGGVSRMREYLVDAGLMSE